MDQIAALLRHDAGPAFHFIEPPFDFNAPNVSVFPVEVSGQHLIRSMCSRFGWPSLAGKRLIDFGCGVRFARTIINLGLDVGLYAGVDTNDEPLRWLRTHVPDSRFAFSHLNMKNPMYNVDGPTIDNPDTLCNMGIRDFDAACMFSVITHQSPEEAEIIFKMLNRSVRSGGLLYFTAFLDEAIDDYVERDPAKARHLSTFPPTLLFDLLRVSGWCISDIYPESDFQQMAFVCTKEPS